MRTTATDIDDGKNFDIQYSFVTDKPEDAVCFLVELSKEIFVILFLMFTKNNIPGTLIINATYWYIFDTSLSLVLFNKS